MHETKRWTSRLACAALFVAPFAGCSEAETNEPEPGAPATGPLYAMMVQVYDADDRTVYIALSDTLDIDSVSLANAREFSSVANFAMVDGRILVSSGSKPEVTEFEVDSGLHWSERRSVSFDNFGLLADGANFYGQFLLDAQHALLPFGDGTSRILWNPKEMAIEATLEDSMLESMEPRLKMEPGGNRNAVHYDDGVIQAFFYHDDDYYDFGSQSHLVVYDAETFREKRILDVPCPELSQATRDEQGNTYFATWSLSTTSITGEAPPMCVAKVAADQKTVTTIDLRDWTDGRIANNFRYVGGGKAIANVLHHEVLGFASAEELDDRVLDEELWVSGPHWRLWLFDVEDGTGVPVQGIDVEISGWSQFSVVDDRTFVFLPYQNDARTRAYELMPDGRAVEHFDTIGDVFKWVRVR